MNSQQKALRQEGTTGSVGLVPQRSACGCGLPDETRRLAESAATIETLAWLVKRCPLQRKWCCIRSALSERIYSN